MIKLFCAATIFLTLTGGCSRQQRLSGRWTPGPEHARKELLTVLQDHGYPDSPVITPVSGFARAGIIHHIEPLLIRAYGFDHLFRQRPYEAYRFGHYWLVTGTLPKNWHGGTFLVILDKRKWTILKMTHGK